MHRASRAARGEAPSALATVGAELSGALRAATRSGPIQWVRSASAWQDEWADALAIQLLVVTLLLRLLWLPEPTGGLIFDESYYVNAARVILGWPVPEGAPYAQAEPFRDPNAEHLPLAKLIIAGSMRLLGDNAYGWRLPSVLFGTAAVALLYLLVRSQTGRPWLALFAAFIFGFDNLVFVHGRIATLDVFMLALMLLGLYAYAVGRPVLAGGALALSTLAKLNGVFGLLAIVGFEALRFVVRPERRGGSRGVIADLLVAAGSFAVVFLAVLLPLDRAFTSYRNPLDHVAHVYSYGVNLRREGGPQGIESAPWQWLVNKVPIPYLKQDVNTMVGDKVVASRSTIHFAGEMNPYVVAMLPLSLAYLLHASLRRPGRSAPTGAGGVTGGEGREAAAGATGPPAEAQKARVSGGRGVDDLPPLLLVVFLATYLPPVASALVFHRVSYIFYFLPALPAVCAGTAYFLLDSRVPRMVPLAYSAAVLLGFAATFPFRELP